MRTIIGTVLVTFLCSSIAVNARRFGARASCPHDCVTQNLSGQGCPRSIIGTLDSSAITAPTQKPATPQANSLCAKDERIIFSCPIKRPAKIVSVCASKDLTSDRGYLQYRFGLPEKVELEFPKERSGSQQKFQYSHYFRAKVDLTEISFTTNGYQYQVTDDYNGEEKTAQTIQGVMVTAPGKPKEVSFACRIKPKADYTDLQAVLPSGQ